MLRIPAESQRTAVKLIDQQMWCWGCDVRRTEGNLLLAYGAQKRPSPNPRYASAYTFQTSRGDVLNLWGWGIWISHVERGSLFVSRSRFRIRYSRNATLMPDAWRAQDLPATSALHTDEEICHGRSLLEAALKWMSEYEYWIDDQIGAEYRKQNIAQWLLIRKHRGGIPAADMSECWSELAAHIVQH